VLAVNDGLGQVIGRCAALTPVQIVAEKNSTKALAPTGIFWSLTAE